MEKKIKSEGLPRVLEDITREAISLNAPAPVIENLEALVFLADMGTISAKHYHGGRRPKSDA